MYQTKFTLNGNHENYDNVLNRKNIKREAVFEK